MSTRGAYREQPPDPLDLDLWSATCRLALADRELDRAKDERIQAAIAYSRAAAEWAKARSKR